MHGSRSQKVRFKRISIKPIIYSLVGQEPPYPVYQFSRATKFERPENPGKQYRWITS